MTTQADPMHGRDTFDAVAGLYGAVRPGYPAALFEDLAAYAGLTGAEAVLEVGCGPGQATGDLAARAGRVLAVDPGPALVDEARARVTAANVDFAVARFEDLEVEAGAFRLVASAQAWHWVAAEIGFPKAARGLAPGGTFAIWGHVPMGIPERFRPAFQAAFEAHAPGLWGRPPPQAWYLPAGPAAGSIAASGLFGPVTHKAYAWTWRQTGQTLGDQLRTESGYHGLPQAQRFALFDALTAAVAADGDLIEAPWETHLYMARRG